MKSSFKAYTREINGETTYFVKRFSLYPEYKDVPPVLESLGMHRDFLKACELAEVVDEEAILDLMKELRLALVDGKAIPIHQLERERYSKSPAIFRIPQQWLARLGWARI